MMRLEKKSPQKTLNSFAAVLLALVCAFTLNGCGGGGGGGGGGAAVMPTPGGGSGQQMPGSGNTGSGDPVGPSEWILSGTVASTTARDEFYPVLAAIDGSEDRVYLIEGHQIVNHAFPIQITDRTSEYWELGYWAHDSLSSDIPKFQSRLEPSFPNYETENNTVVGTMSNGLFYIGKVTRGL